MRRAFTLIEILISIALLVLVMLALNRSVVLLRNANIQLFDYLKKTKKETKVMNLLYSDLIQSDGNITFPKKDNMTQLCIGETTSSLYELPTAKVCWVVLKKDYTLIRVEGNGYDLPTTEDQHVEIDELLKNIELFDIYQKEDKVLVLLKEQDKAPMTFMLQNGR